MLISSHRSAFADGAIRCQLLHNGVACAAIPAALRAAMPADMHQLAWNSGLGASHGRGPQAASQAAPNG
jgi:hypothetical protein